MPSVGKKLKEKGKKLHPSVASIVSFSVSMKLLRIGKEHKREVSGLVGYHDGTI